MDQDQTVETQPDATPVEQPLDAATDNDLQKAIDDITNTTNIDPVFSDPVAAPSSVPEGDTGELGEPVGPFPEPQVSVVEQGAEQIAPIDGIEIPDLGEPPALAPLEAPEAPATLEVPELTTLAPEPTIELGGEGEDSNVRQIRESALRDLIPLLDKLKMTPSQRFGICRDIFEDLHDYKILEPAYKAAKEIEDEGERAEALLYLVESVDKM